MKEWKDVENELPELGEKVLGYDVEKKEFRICIYGDEEGFVLDEVYGPPAGFVKYWMPLPDAPKVEDSFEIL